jgi:DNA (cytosine-5)-methyltransferase 1
MKKKGKPLKVAGLFTGIGGFELGMSRAGHEASLFCEIEPSAKAVLSHHFPKVPLAKDIRELQELPKGVDLVAAGFPCQNLSSSGLKDGITGAQSSLVSEVFRLLEKRPVEWVLIENVHFMLHLNKGAGIRAIVDNFERLGYSWAYRVLDTSSFGLPQRRRRVFVLASLHHDPREVLLAEDVSKELVVVPSIDRPVGFYWTEGTYATGLAANSIPPLKGGSALGIPSPPAIMMPDGFVGTPDIRDAERFQGFDEDWTLPAAEGHRNSVRWRLVGNAVSVNVAEWLGKKVLAPMPYDAGKDEPMPAVSWPMAAWNIGSGRFASGASTSPAIRKGQGLDEFLLHPLKPLSEKATKGFLARARKGNLWFPDGFLNRLDQHLARYA